MASEYVFIDEWDVDAPRTAVFTALADASTYPQWWKPVYIAVDTDGPPQVGRVSAQEFKGRLPYHLKTRSEIVAYEPPETFTIEVVGDLTGRGVWTLTDTPDDGVHVHFDWRVIADRALLRYLTPVLRPVFRWNHNWSIKRAIEGLEPYARAPWKEKQMASSSEIVSEAYAAFGRGDIPALLETLSEDVDWVAPDILPQGGSFRGHDGVGRFFEGVGREWPELEIEIEDLVADGEHVVGLGRGKGKLAGGEPADYGFAHVFTVADGKIVRFREYADPGAGLAS